MMRLRDQGKAQFYWDFVRDFETNTKAFSFAEMNSRILGDQGTHPAREEKIPVKILSCASKEAQAQYVHRWLQENYTAKGGKVGIVICDETMVEPVIYALPAIRLEGEEEDAKINITKGFPLRNTAAYKEELEGIQREKNILLDEEQGEEEQDKPLTWRELLVMESEYQVMKIKNQIRVLKEKGLGDIPFTDKLEKMLKRRMMEAVTMPFHGEPVTDIQVMGVLETRLLDFDMLLMLNVDEGILRQRQAASTSIPDYSRNA